MKLSISIWDRSLLQGAVGLVVFFGLASSLGCKARYEIVGQTSDPAATAGLSVSPAAAPDGALTLCSPASVNVPPVAGVQGLIYTNPNSPATGYASIIQNGFRQKHGVALNQIAVPTTASADGFPLPNGKRLTDDNGTVLLTNYALDLKSNLMLSPGQSEGDYQLALLSDDGANLLVQNTAGSSRTLIASDGLHSTLLACATSTVHMQPGVPLPIELQYYQGPATAIALQVMWRKVNTALPNAFTESLCGAAGDGQFWTMASGTRAAAPTANYARLLADGWMVPAQENYVAQLAQSNLCQPLTAPATVANCQSFVELTPGPALRIPARDASQTCYFVKVLAAQAANVTAQLVRQDISANVDAGTAGAWTIAQNKVEFSLVGERSVMFSANRQGNAQMTESGFLLMEMSTPAGSVNLAYGTAASVPTKGLRLGGQVISYGAVTSTGSAAIAPIDVANQFQTLQTIGLKLSAIGTTSLGQTSDIYLTFR